MSIVNGSSLFIVVDYNDRDTSVPVRVVDGAVYATKELARIAAEEYNIKHNITTCDVEEVEYIVVTK